MSYALRITTTRLNPSLRRRITDYLHSVIPRATISGEGRNREERLEQTEIFISW